MRRSYSDIDIIDAVLTSTSVAEVCRKLRIKPVGGNYKTIKQNVIRLCLDTSHFTGQAWSKGLSLVDTPISLYAVKKRIIDLYGYSCRNCGIDSWLGNKIVLELDHIDGDNLNNDPANLRLLCPNCHSQTPTFRNRKR